MDNRKLKLTLKGCDSIKSIKAAKSKEDEWIKQYQQIIPIKSKFDIDIEHKTYCTEIDSITIIKDCISGFDFKRVDNYFGYILHKLSTASLKIIGYLIEHIDFNSNRIELDTEKVCDKLNICSRNFYSAVAELDKYDLLYRTSKQGIYSINPLHLFKGDLLTFIQRYQDKYGNSEVQLDNKGRIILDD